MYKLGDVLLMIPELYISVVHALRLKRSQKIWLCFTFVSILGY